MLVTSKSECKLQAVEENTGTVPNANSANALWENEHLSQIPFKVLRGHQQGVTSCQFCMSGERILSASKDGNSQLWNIFTNKVMQTFTSHTLPVTRCKISPDESKLLSSSWDKTLCYFDIETGDVLWRASHDGIVMFCDLSSDGKYALSCTDFNNTVKLWDLRDGSIIEEIVGHHSSTPTSCVFSPNSQRIATTSMDRTTKVWDLLSKKTTITLSGHKNIVSSCCFSENERFLCTASWDKSLQMWDISTGMFRSQGAFNLTKGHDGSVSCCKFSSDVQHLISGGYDCAVVVWDVENKCKKVVLKGHDGWINGVDISRDGKSILSCSDDKTIRLWNIEEADHIPAVIENRRAMGLKIVKCEKCSKPFSIAQLEDPADIGICVFCRLADPERNKLPYI
ncbi:WD repeat-containing protein 88-like [Clavelina lepadiformis]|uniref:WD repeat-containing protein 88-like n=1 Tax=Clavelina lepadiformis TaxID=159417 RepID=UPI0040428BB6